MVVNTCAFIEEARQESIDVVLDLADRKGDGARLVVTGCMAERYGDELAEALPEVDAVAGFGVPVTLGRKAAAPRRCPASTCSTCPGPASTAPWAYVKVAEGCDRACGFCAIPSFRGPQRSRSMAAVLDEVEALAAGGVRRSCSSPRTWPPTGATRAWGSGRLVPLVAAVAERVDRVRLLYLYPSDLTDALVDAICATGVPYFDLSLQHVAAPLVRRMRRWGDGAKFLERIDGHPRREPEAAFRSNFIVGYPGETEARPRRAARLRARRASSTGAASSPTRARTAPTPPTSTARCPPASMDERLAELRELQDDITALRARRAHRHGGRGARGRPRAWPGATARPPRSTASSPCPRRSRWGRSTRCASPAPPAPTARPSRSPSARSPARERGQRRSQFGPSALATPANVLTLGRLVLTSRSSRWSSGSGASWTAVDALDRAVPHRRGRRPRRPAPRHHPLGRLPRPAGRQGAGARRAVRAGGRRLVLVAARAALIAVRELGIQAFRSFWARRGLAVPATKLAKVQDRRPGARRGLRAAARCVADDADVVRHRPAVGRRWCSPSSPACST